MSVAGADNYKKYNTYKKSQIQAIINNIQALKLALFQLHHTATSKPKRVESPAAD